MPQFSREPTFGRKKYFLILLNQQFLSTKGETFYEYYMNVLVNVKFEVASQKFLLIFNLLEETRNFTNILNDNSVPFSKLKKIVVSGRMSNDSLENLFEIDDLVGNIIAYWTTNDENYKEIKGQLEKVGIVYEMLFMIIEGHQDEFEENFTKFKLNISEFYLKRYGNIETRTTQQTCY
jgi:hypothetical protein